MGVAFANNWENILDKLESILRTEFKGALKVYRGLKNEIESSQYLRIYPISSDIINYSIDLETREFNIGMSLYFKSPNIKKTGIDQIMRLSSRIEALIVDNMSMALPDSSFAYDCRIESTEITSSPEEYVVDFEYKCLHANDSLSPFVVITSAEVVDGGASADSTLSMTFTTNVTTTDFVGGDITVSNGSIGTLSGSGKTYTATLTPTANGAVTVQVAADKFSDSIGNKNSASEVFNWTYQERFISEWTVSGDDDDRTVTLPLVQNNYAGSANDINFTVDWGDPADTADTVVENYNDSTRSHIYASNGTYTVAISGTIQGFQFDSTDHSTKLTKITSWGSFQITNTKAFKGCTRLVDITATNAPTISTTSLERCFQDCSQGGLGLTTIGVGEWDTSSVTKMDYFVYGCIQFTQDIGYLDLSSCTTMTYMVSNCTALNFDVSDWNVANVTNMQGAFQYCTAFNNGGVTLDWGSKVSKVTNMTVLFGSCSSFAGLGLEGWVITALTTATNMFLSANALVNSTYINILVNWNSRTHEDDVVIHFGDADPSTAGDDARDDLVADGWTITDGEGIHT